MGCSLCIHTESDTTEVLSSSSSGLKSGVSWCEKLLEFSFVTASQVQIAGTLSYDTYILEL